MGRVQALTQELRSILARIHNCVNGGSYSTIAASDNRALTGIILIYNFTKRKHSSMHVYKSIDIMHTSACEAKVKFIQPFLYEDDVIIGFCIATLK